MDDLLEQKEGGINFVPCLAWVRRGVAKPVPEQVKLTKEELAQVIEQTKLDLGDLTLKEEGGDGEEDENGDCVKEEEVDDKEEVKVKIKEEEEEGGRAKKMPDSESEDDIEKKYGLEDYDKEDENAEKFLGIGEISYYAVSTVYSMYSTV